MNMVAMYQEASEQLTYEELVAKHMPLVKRVAYHLMARMPNSVQLDDLVQAGMVGLLEAMQNYDASKGASFETYARIRIRGSMIDEVRRGDWTPRSVYHKARRLAEAMHAVENREQRAAQDEEVAAELGVDLASYYKILADTNGCHVLSYDDLSADGWVSDDDDGSADGPLPELQKNLFKEGLSSAIETLPERERMVLSLYYDNEFNLREIGEVLGVSEARICQIHAQALTRLRSKMSDWVGDDDE